MSESGRNEGREALLARLSVALVRTAYAGNAGAVARVMTNFGVRQGIMVAPRCDINSIDARQYATGPSALTLATMNTVKSIDQCLEGFSSVIGVTRRTGQMRKASVTLDEVMGRLRSGPVLLVFGPEETGLSEDEIQCCTDVLTIDVSAAMPSLNLSHAVAVVLSHIYFATAALAPDDDATLKSADASELLSLYSRLDSSLKSLETSGKLANAGRFARILSQTLSRARLDEHELAAWHGLLSLLK